MLDARLRTLVRTGLQRVELAVETFPKPATGCHFLRQPSQSGVERCASGKSGCPVSRQLKHDPAIQKAGMERRPARPFSIGSKSGCSKSWPLRPSRRPPRRLARIPVPPINRVMQDAVDNPIAKVRNSGEKMAIRLSGVILSVDRTHGPRFGHWGARL